MTKLSQNLRPGTFHAVRFYEDAMSLARIVAEFLGEGFVAGQPAIVIATPEHAAGVTEQLVVRGFDIERVKDAGDLTLLDASATLQRFMVDGMPDPARFRETLVPLLDQVCRGRASSVRAYGEMVDVLWQAGRTVAAVKLEMLWNELARTKDFSLLCGYAMGHFYKHAAVDDICEQHTHVVAKDGVAARVQ